MKKKRSRSPLKAKPLRLPGQSVEEELFDVRYDKVLTPLAVAFFLVVLAIVEWLRWYLHSPPSPIAYTLVAGMAVLYAVFRVASVRPQLNRLKQGRDGERIVGQFLERLREMGYQVFHDVVGDGFNLDHVLIGPAGVFSVETKTYSKRIDREAKVAFDGHTLTIDGLTPDRDPVVQSKAQAGWLREIINEITGKKLKVRPVILFPGWFVEQAPGATREIWVLNPKALADFLEHEPEVLSEAETRQISAHLSRFIRGTVTSL